MPHNQKAAFTVLAIAGVLALGLGLWQLRHNIKTPFLLRPLQTTQVAEETWIDMQSKDTDKDGLSDYDETYLHGTSPYLEDSDSDGKKDGEEINAGSDPNCPEGKDCKNLVSPPETSIGFDTPNSLFNNQPVDNQPAENIDLNNLSTKDIRELLKASGIDEKLLSQLDDKSLMEIYDEALKATQ